MKLKVHESGVRAARQVGDADGGQLPLRHQGRDDPDQGSGAPRSRRIARGVRLGGEAVRLLGADEKDLVPFEKYAAAAQGLASPRPRRARSLAARPTSSVSIAWCKASPRKGMRNAAIDGVVALVDARLELNRRATQAAVSQAARRRRLNRGRLSSSMPSSWILRVMVLRPMPRRLAASMRRARGALERLGDQRCARTDAKRVEDPGLAAREALGFVLERGEPVGARGRGLVAELGRQVADVDDLSRRHHGEPVAQVLELPHVAREFEPREVRKRVVGKPLGVYAELFRAHRQEMLGQ